MGTTLGDGGHSNTSTPARAVPGQPSSPAPGAGLFNVPGALGWVGVSDADATAQAVRAAGGTVVLELRDPQGAVFGVYAGTAMRGPSGIDVGSMSMVPPASWRGSVSGRQPNSSV